MRHIRSTQIKGCETKRANAEDTGGQNLPRAPVRHKAGFTRELKITDKLLEMFGFTQGCRGCEAKINGGEQENRILLNADGDSKRR